MAVFARSGEQTRAPRRGVWMLAIAPIAAIALAAGAAYAADAAYAHRALPGMTVGGVDISSLEASSIRERLSAELAAPWASSTVMLVDGSRTWRTTNDDLGIAPDIDAAVNGAVAYGNGSTRYADRRISPSRCTHMATRSIAGWRPPLATPIAHLCLASFASARAVSR